MSNIYSKDFCIQGNELYTVECEKSEGQGKNTISISGANYNKYTAPFSILDDPLNERLKKSIYNFN
ncbi:MAG: hypothetical protein M9916_12405 [Crocinitomicaceae bacterium]|nr:hypothetical protein [Crocinitomicaceae bacterium]